MKFENLTIENNLIGFRIDNWAVEGFTEERLKELVKENQWIGVTISDSAQFIENNENNLFSLDRLVPCENCTTWIYVPDGKIKELT